MHERERRRCRTAFAAFERAFEEGFAIGVRDLESGEARRADIAPTYDVDVPRTIVLDGAWLPYRTLFREAGRLAALAENRTRHPALDAPSLRDAPARGPFRFRVRLDGSDLLPERDRAKRVLFLSTGNAARGPIAQALLQQVGGRRFIARCAGAMPESQVHPMAVRVMADHGIDISRHQPQNGSSFENESFDFVIAISDRATESSAAMAKAERVHWSFPDPTEEANDEESLRRAFVALYQGLKKRIELFVTVHSKEAGAATFDGERV